MQLGSTSWIYSLTSLTLCPGVVVHIFVIFTHINWIWAVCSLRISSICYSSTCRFIGTSSVRLSEETPVQTLTDQLPNGTFSKVSWNETFSWPLVDTSPPIANIWIRQKTFWPGFVSHCVVACVAWSLYPMFGRKTTCNVILLQSARLRRRYGSSKLICYFNCREVAQIPEHGRKNK